MNSSGWTTGVAEQTPKIPASGIQCYRHDLQAHTSWLIRVTW